ncbi:MAG: hypothetical protein M1823_004576 [Watsoniomyces obsoletus]|nr:MAG: hypothetical protein M1823_004576 [Watsoniomyces obsoletus]
MGDSLPPTVPNSPSAYADISDDIHDCFGFLHPRKESAEGAFAAVANAVLADPDRFQHQGRFLHLFDKTPQASSVFTGDEDEEAPIDFSASPEPEASGQARTGAFKFQLSSLPKDPTQGWYLGTGRGHETSLDHVNVDILLGLPTDPVIRRQVSGRHARLFFHSESCRVVLEARHSVFVLHGGRLIRQGGRHVLEDGDMIMIGQNVYSWAFGDYFRSRQFESDLATYMRRYRDPHWTMNTFLSPSSVGTPRMVGGYYCSPLAIAQGTFGKVAAGWTGDGSAVAIKTLKRPRVEDYARHVEVMKKIGSHENVLRLLYSENTFQSPIPDAYHVYSPLLMVSAAQLVDDYTIPTATTLKLLQDFVRGLSHLHGKDVMHRDIKPGNLGVTSIHGPRGVIIDLDSATDELTSTDHRQGTMAFLAPETIDLKEWDKAHPNPESPPPPYSKSVDLWALGLSTVVLWFGKGFTWRSRILSVTEAEQMDDWVTPEKYIRFLGVIKTKLQPATEEEDWLLQAVLNMMEFKSSDRTTASALLDWLQQRLNAPHRSQSLESLQLKRKRRLESIAST